MTGDQLEIRLLGAPSVVIGSELRSVTRPREQAVLARLALAAPNPVPVDVLVGDVWGDEPPTRAVESLRVHVSNLRKLLAGEGRPGSDVLRTTSAGYALDVAPQELDVVAFERARAGDIDDHARTIIGSWSDQDLGRLDAGTGFFEAAARRIEETHLDAVEALVASDIEAGRVAGTVPLLEQTVRRAPFRESLWILLVRALGTSNRRADALRTFRRARQALAEVGMEPGADLLAAETAVLADERPRSTAARLDTRYVDVDGSRIAFATLGQEPVDLLFLHGGFVPFELMREPPQLQRFVESLAERFRVVFVDRRGIGMSDPPAGGQRVTMDHWVADCLGVLDTVGSETAIVLGHEHGGPVAIRLAEAAPDRIAGLVLHGTAARPLRAPDHPYGPGEDYIEQLDRMIGGLPGTTDLLPLVAPSAGEDPALRAWLERAGRLGAGPARARELHRLYQYSDVRALLPHVRAPAVVLHASRHLRTDPGQARYLAEHLPNAELQLLDSADHLFWLADADAVLSAIDRLRSRVATIRHDPPVHLRALVAVCPPMGADIFGARGAETCLSVNGALVATFTTLEAAQGAVADLNGITPGLSVALEVADTTATTGDAAVVDVAARAAR